MKQVIVGTYDCGLDQIELILREGTGGEFFFKPEDGKVPRVKVGADVDGWNDVVSILLHEVFEMQMTKSHCRFEPAPDYGRDHSSYLFLMNHPIFSDVTARVAGFLALCLPDLSRAWNKWRHPSPKKSRSTKTKK